MLVLFSGENGARDTIRFIEEKAAVGIWFCDLKTRKMEWSSGFFRLLGLEPDSAEPSFALFETMVHPDDVRPTGEFEHLLNRAGPIERRFRLILDNRRVRHLLNRGEVLLDREGKPDIAIGVLADVTELTEALSSLETQRQRLRRLTEALPAIVLTVNASGEVEDLWNWQNFTGVNANLAWPTDGSTLYIRKSSRRSNSPGHQISAAGRPLNWNFVSVAPMAFTAGCRPAAARPRMRAALL
jgi:PAS fold